MLSVRELSKSFGSNQILSGISFDIGRGEVVGLVGKNGSGKTTLMKCILGLAHPNGGEIEFEGNSEYFSSKEHMQNIGFLLDCKLFEDLNAFDNIKIQVMYSNCEWSKKSIEDILSFVDLPNNSKKVKNYSFGMKQRLGLGIALINNPKLLIVDEPFVGLDPIGVKTIKDYLMNISREMGTAVLISSHQLSEIEDMCDRFLFIEDRTIEEHKSGERKIVTIELETIPDHFDEMMKDEGIKLDGRELSLDFEIDKFNRMIGTLVGNGVRIKDINTKDISLEELFR